MKFDSLYPDAPAEFISESFNGLPPVIKLPECDDPECESNHTCEVCGTATSWTNGTSMMYVCSQECNLAIWERMLITLVAQQIVKGP